MINSCSTCGAKNRLPANRLHQRARCGHCKAQLSPPERPLTVNSAADFDELIKQSEIPVVVDFWAPWCAPCRLVAPEMVKLADERHGKLLVAKVNTEDVPDIAQRYGIQGIPTFVAFHGGKETGRTSGAQPVSGILRQLHL